VKRELEAASDLVQTWLRAWVGDVPFDGCCSHDIQYEDPLAHDPLRGLDALEAHAAHVREAFPDLRIDRTGETLTRGDFMCVPWRAVGTHKNGTPALPATNRFVALHGLHYLELADGVVRRGRGFFDLYDAATQLGILPTRGGIGESVLLLLRGFGIRSN
jgi:SnoaL-like polyketide cyclase